MYESSERSLSSIALRSAVRARCVPLVKFLLWSGVNVNSRDRSDSGRTALHLACKSEHEDMQRVVDTLLEAGAEVNVQSFGLKETPLHTACMSMNPSAVTKLLRHGANINSRDWSRRTALHLACESEHEDMQRVVDTLLEAGAKVNVHSYGRGETPLHTACMRMNPSAVTKLLRHGANINSRDCSEKTALHFACEFEHENMERVVDTLLEAGAEVNVQSFGLEETPLHTACRRMNPSIVTKLLRHGANINSRDRSLRTPLLLACGSKHEDMQRVIDVLLEAGAEVNVQCSNGETPLHTACMSMNISVVTKLLRHGANINSRDCSGRTALHMACVSKYKYMQRVVDVLLEAGAEVNVQSFGSEETPLHTACMSMNISVVTKLLRHGANINSRDRSLRTALHFACESEHEDMQRVVDVLLEAGADVNVQCSNGETPLHKACRCKNPSVVITLLKHLPKIGLVDNSSRTPFHVVATMDNNHSIVEALQLNFSAEGSENRFFQHLSDSLEDYEVTSAVNVQDRRSDTALHIACEKNNKKFVCLLLSFGAKVGVKDSNGLTALHRAVKGRAGDVVNVLVDKGEDVNAQDYSGNTPLHIASMHNDKVAVCLFLHSGANVGVRNMKGMTALHKAVSALAYDVVSVLLDNGEDVNAQDLYGDTPLHMSSRQNNIELVRLLLGSGAKVGVKNKEGKTPYLELAGDSSVNGLEEMKMIEELYIKEDIRLQALGLRKGLNVEWRLGLDFYDSVRNLCLKELESIKSTKVVKDISMFQVFSHSNQPFILSRDDLLQIDEFLSSPDLLARFPLYGDTLRITFQRAKLLTLAVQSFYTDRRKQMVKELPRLVVEHLLTFLSKKDLETFIESEKFQ